MTQGKMGKFKRDRTFWKCNVLTASDNTPLCNIFNNDYFSYKWWEYGFRECWLGNKPLSSSVSPWLFLLTSLSNEFLFTVKDWAADFLVWYSQAPFSALFSSSPVALNSFQARKEPLLWQYWGLGLWARQVSLLDSSPSPHTHHTLGLN